jgi:hypothetical protein
MRIQATQIANPSASCYRLLTSSLHKVTFETSYSCYTDRAVSNVTVNNSIQNFDVSTDQYGLLLCNTAS